MSIDLQARLSDAVAHFWKVRQKQNARQGKGSGRRDQGSRSAVTGGKQLDGFVTLIRDVLYSAGLEGEHVHVERKRTILPGYFRATKEWDIVAIVNGRLLASVECKSQVGPSFGNNFNNRTEEAIGSSHDLWVAYREGAFQKGPRPWLGYLLLLEDCPASNQPVRVDEPHFKAFQEFKDASYCRRYQLLCQRLVRERLYDAACMLLSSNSEGIRGIFSEPSSELGINHFAAALAAHARMFARD